MVVLYECPECGAVRTSKRDILSHCRNVIDHTTYDYDEMKAILDGGYERELQPPAR
jgi:hypothetical protein